MDPDKGSDFLYRIVARDTSSGHRGLGICNGVAIVFKRLRLWLTLSAGDFGQWIIRGHNTDYQQDNPLIGIMSPDYPDYPHINHAALLTILFFVWTGSLIAAKKSLG